MRLQKGWLYVLAITLLLLIYNVYESVTIYTADGDNIEWLHYYAVEHFIKFVPFFILPPVLLYCIKKYEVKMAAE